MSVDLGNCYFDRVRGFVSEFKIDARWVLRDKSDDKPYGSLRVVSHPDLRPGYLRATFQFVTSIRNKTKDEKIQTVIDNDMDMNELEVYSIDRDIKTETEIHEGPYKEINQIFGVDIFGK